MELFTKSVEENRCCTCLCFEGTGVITVNKKRILQPIPTATLQYKVMQPMSMTENATNFDVKVNVYGGGSGQAEAVRMALARVMCEVNAENRLLKPEVY
jgi:small subunit ribosomal protein S9